MALTTYPITGDLKDALGGDSLIGEVTLTPYGSHDARVDGANALLGAISYDLDKTEAEGGLPATLDLTAGAWIITIRAKGRVQGEQQFKTIQHVIDHQAATTWGAIVSGAVSSPPMTPTLVQQAQDAATAAEASATTASADAAAADQARADAEAAAATATAPTDSMVASLAADPASATGAELRETFAGVEAAKIQTNTAIILGDSLSQQNGAGPSSLDPATGTSTALSGRGWWNWCNAFLGQRFNLVRNAGVGGNTTAQMLARINADVLAYASDWVMVEAGANDVANDVATATIQANLTAILDAIEDDGRRVVLMTLPPSSNYSTTARRTVLSQVNAWIRTLPLTRRNLVVVDVWRVLADPATGNPATGMAVDAVHWTEMGALRVGKAVANALDPLVPKRPARTLGLLDANNIIGNPHFGTGTDWSVLGAGVTAAYQTAEDRWASKAVLTLTGITDITERGIQYVEPLSAGRYAAGDIIQASARFKWSGATAVTAAAGTFRPWLRLYARNVDNSFEPYAAQAFLTASAEQVQPVGNDIAAGELVAITHRKTLPATVNNLYVGVGWQGMAAGTVEVSDLSVWKNA